jgi:polygalacturonase
MSLPMASPFFNVTDFGAVGDGATILGSHRPEDYPVVEGRWEGMDMKTHTGLIAGWDLGNVAITGRGTG